MPIIWNALEIPFEGVIPPDSKWAIMFIKVEMFKYLCLILCLPRAEKFCFRPQLQENLYAGAWFSISLLISIYHPQYHTLCHRTYKWSTWLYNKKQESKASLTWEIPPNQVTSFRSLHWHHRSHESPIFITIFASTGVDPKKKRSSECCRRDDATHLLPEKLFGKYPPLSRVAYFWRTCGSSCGRYWVLLNKSSTSASALITAQLWPARPPGSVGVCQLPNSGGSGGRNVCVFVPFCLCVCWDIRRLSGPLPWCSSIQEGLGGWRHLWSFGKRAEG